MFNTTIVGVPYTRINNINIAYTGPLTAEVKFTEQEYVLLADGERRPISQEDTKQFLVSPEDMGTSVPLLDIDTGNYLGMDVSYGQVMLGILAVIRSRQV